jgi:hypothetical protein
MEKIVNLQPRIDQLEAKLASLGHHESADTIDDSSVTCQYAPSMEKSYIDTGLAVSEVMGLLEKMPKQSRVHYSNIKDQIVIHHVRLESPDEWEHRKKLYRESEFAKWQNKVKQIKDELESLKKMREQQLEYLQHFLASYGYDMVEAK